MRKEKALLVLMILVLCTIGPAAAQTITMANPMGLSERDMMVYYPNGTLQGFYNSTSVITLDSTTDYIFTMKPVQTNPFEDPGDWLTNTFIPFVQSQSLALVMIAVIIGFMFRRR